jgi:hypothetical protein
MIPCGGKGWGGVDLAEDKPRLSSQGQTKVLTQREDTSILHTAFQPQITWPVCRPGPHPDLPARSSTSAPCPAATCSADWGPTEDAAWLHSPSESTLRLFDFCFLSLPFFFFFFFLTKELFFKKLNCESGKGEERHQEGCM